MASESVFFSSSPEFLGRRRKCTVHPLYRTRSETDVRLEGDALFKNLLHRIEPVWNLTQTKFCPLSFFYQHKLALQRFGALPNGNHGHGEIHTCSQGISSRGSQWTSLPVDFCFWSIRQRQKLDKRPCVTAVLSACCNDFFVRVEMIGPKNALHDLSRPLLAERPSRLGTGFSFSFFFAEATAGCGGPAAMWWGQRCSWGPALESLESDKLAHQIRALWWSVNAEDTKSTRWAGLSTTIQRFSMILQLTKEKEHSSPQESFFYCKREKKAAWKSACYRDNEMKDASPFWQTTVETFKRSVQLRFCQRHEDEFLPAE